jgi:hypothetical protein
MNKKVPDTFFGHRADFPSFIYIATSWQIPFIRAGGFYEA